MSREIKFRLRKDGQIVGYEMWFGGDGLAKPRWIYAYPNGQFNLGNPYIEHDSKEEFTGLKDKNSHEIYKGDIIKYKKWNQTSSKLRAVSWIVAKQYCGWNVASTDNYEIIGNTTDNPELLEEAA